MIYNSTHEMITASMAGTYHITAVGVHKPLGVASNAMAKILKNGTSVWTTPQNYIHVINVRGLPVTVDHVLNLAADDSIQLQWATDGGVKMQISASMTIKQIS